MGWSGERRGGGLQLVGVSVRCATVDLMTEVSSEVPVAGEVSSARRSTICDFTSLSIASAASCSVSVPSLKPLSVTSSCTTACDRTGDASPDDDTSPFSAGGDRSSATGFAVSAICVTGERSVPLEVRATGAQLCYGSRMRRERCVPVQRDSEPASRIESGGGGRAPAMASAVRQSRALVRRVSRQS